MLTASAKKREARNSNERKKGGILFLVKIHRLGFEEIESTRVLRDRRWWRKECRRERGWRGGGGAEGWPRRSLSICYRIPTCTPLSSIPLPPFRIRVLIRIRKPRRLASHLLLLRLVSVTLFSSQFYVWIDGMNAFGNLIFFSLFMVRLMKILSHF